MRYIANIISILLIAFLVFSMIQIKNRSLDSHFGLKMKNFLQEFSNFFKVQKQNIAVETFPQKKKALTLIEKETALRMFAPATFGNFTEADWQDFWSIIYEPIKDKQGKFTIKRHRTKEEIEAELVSRYPNPFSFLRAEHWRMFWYDILNINWVDEEEQK
ncbi:MAG: hypothetical protein NC918_05190 [Candidatus Omnitrophica bacterium]|nr:hypothetical protein [Candidatus Omnitrophota bacterium]